MSRDIGPRVGGRFHSTRQNAEEDNDVDVNAYIERTPKTNEQMNREKSSSNWEYNFWTVVVIGVIIVLLILVIWFIFKKDETAELQQHTRPPPYQGHHAGQQGQHQGQNQGHHQAQHQQDAKPNPPISNNEVDMAADVRANLTNKKQVKRNIGPVPNEVPDNPAVVGIVSTVVQTSQPGSTTDQPKNVEEHAELIPDVQIPLITNRLVTNLGLAE